MNDDVELSEGLRTSLDPTPVTGGPAGTFTVSATFTNVSSSSIQAPFFKAVELSGGNSLLNADSGMGGVGSTVTPIVPNSALAPGESVLVDFVVGLQTFDRFSFFVDMFSTPPSGNEPPIADAGVDSTATIGELVNLDGSGSSDPNGDPLSFRWSLVSVPTGSSASLSDRTSVMPRFAADVNGEYVAELIVNDGFVDSEPDTVSIDTENTAPVADAGLDQTVPIGDTVSLDGSDSSDTDGDPLTFQRALIARLIGSSAALSDSTAVMPTFEVDAEGIYQVALVVNDGIEDSEPDTVEITTQTPPINRHPTADAGSNQVIPVGNVVTLDGSDSSDPDGDPLTFAWSLTTVPAGSTTTLSDSTAIMPTFTADEQGTFVAQLIVNDGTADSEPELVVVSTDNAPPIADAGPDQSVPIGTSVVLDGGASSDPDNDPLTYAWSLTTVPPGSAATLSDPTAIVPTFSADLQGTYVVQLIVNDGTADSAPDTVVVVTSNPIADAGPDQMVSVGEEVTLDGSGSSATGGGALTFDWILEATPQGSNATLSNPNSIAPTFTADVAGDYIAELVVNDGTLNSLPDSVSITATTTPGGGSDIQCGDLVSDAIDVEGEVDLFTFTGQMGEVVTIALAETSDWGGNGFNDARATLFSPTGAQVGVQFDSNSQQEFTLPESGSYTIRVNANNLVSTGSYNLWLQCL